MEHCHSIAFYTEQYQIIELNTEYCTVVSDHSTEYGRAPKQNTVPLDSEKTVCIPSVPNMLRRIQHYPSVFMYDYVCTVQVCMYIVQYSKVENITVDQEYFKS